MNDPTRDPFLKMRSRATKAGAWAGLAGAIVGLWIVGLSLEFIFALQTGEPALLTIIPAFLCCSGYPLLGVAGGALIGRLGVKPNDDPEDGGAVFRHRIIGAIGGGIAGLVIGILPYVLLWSYAMSTGVSLF